MIRIRIPILLHLLFLFLITTTITVALPANPITSPLLLSLANRTNPLSSPLALRLPPTALLPPQPHPLAPRPFNSPTPLPPDPPIHCLEKPSTLLPINEYICAIVLHRLLHPIMPFHRTFYTAPVTPFGSADCHIELRRSHGKSGIWLSDEVIAGAALAVLQKCEDLKGAGWALLVGEENWYVLIYGGSR